MDRAYQDIERLFRRLTGFRRVGSRFDKLDLVFIAFICFALIIEALRSCEQALAEPDHSCLEKLCGSRDIHRGDAWGQSVCPALKSRYQHRGR